MAVRRGVFVELSRHNWTYPPPFKATPLGNAHRARMLLSETFIQFMVYPTGANGTYPRPPFSLFFAFRCEVFGDFLGSQDPLV